MAGRIPYRPQLQRQTFAIGSRWQEKGTGEHFLASHRKRNSTPVAESHTQRQRLDQHPSTPTWQPDRRCSRLSMAVATRQILQTTETKSLGGGQQCLYQLIYLFTERGNQRRMGSPLVQALKLRSIRSNALVVRRSSFIQTTRCWRLPYSATTTRRKLRNCAPVGIIEATTSNGSGIITSGS